MPFKASGKSLIEFATSAETVSHCKTDNRRPGFLDWISYFSDLSFHFTMEIVATNWTKLKINGRIDVKAMLKIFEIDIGVLTSFNKLAASINV